MTIRKILYNTGWLSFGYVFKLGTGLIVSVLVARYLGPESFGVLNYAISLISFMAIFIYLGLSGLVVTEIVRKPTEVDTILGSTFFLKGGSALLSVLIVSGVALYIHGYNTNEFWVIFIVGLSLFARPFECIDYWFQSKTQSKYTVIAENSALIISVCFKLIFVFSGATVLAFAAADSLQVFLFSLILVVVYHKKGGSIFSWRIKIAKAFGLISRSWVLIVSGFLSMVNLKIDQIMLRWMVDAREVGFYSIAVLFSETWYFIPTVIIVSIYPKLIELSKDAPSEYNIRIQQTFDILFIIGFVVALGMSVVAGHLIPLLYGPVYAKSANILIIHVWAGIFMFMRALFSKWILIENLLYFSLISHGLGALMNILINLLLIPEMGGQGAAISTLISYATASYFFLFFFKRTRAVAYKMSMSFLFPFRFAAAVNKIWKR